MAKVKLNLTLDEDIKERLVIAAEEKHMTVSALITQYALTLKTTQCRGQMSTPLKKSK